MMSQHLIFDNNALISSNKLPAAPVTWSVVAERGEVCSRIE
jgi:hypothetical protein